eukprot:2501576-Rhodomonas_salina.1
MGCDGVIHGKVEDDCGVCGGDGKTCAGCDGEPKSGKTVDTCGVCGGDGSSCTGCDGIANSGLRVDSCGVCGGSGEWCEQCDGAVDQCGVCKSDGKSCAWVSTASAPVRIMTSLTVCELLLVFCRVLCPLCSAENGWCVGKFAWWVLCCAVCARTCRTPQHPPPQQNKTKQNKPPAKATHITLIPHQVSGRLPPEVSVEMKELLVTSVASVMNVGPHEVEVKSVMPATARKGGGRRSLLGTDGEVEGLERREGGSQPLVRRTFLVSVAVVLQRGEEALPAFKNLHDGIGTKLLDGILSQVCPHFLIT